MDFNHTYTQHQISYVRVLIDVCAIVFRQQTNAVRLRSTVPSGDDQLRRFTELYNLSFTQRARLCGAWVALASTMLSLGRCVDACESICEGKDELGKLKEVRNTSLRHMEVDCRRTALRVFTVSSRIFLAHDRWAAPTEFT